MQEQVHRAGHEAGGTGDRRLIGRPLGRAAVPQPERQHHGDQHHPISTKDAAEPNGQLRAEVNWFCTRLPIITCLAPPSRSEVRKDPRAGHENQEAAGDDSGKRRAAAPRGRTALRGRAPSVSAASSSDGSSFSSEA